jgi:hypothetical protein
VREVRVAVVAESAGNSSKRGDEPATASSEAPGQVFEVRITGLVAEDALAAVLEQLPEVEVVTHELRTSLRQHFHDQAELHGFLATLRALRLDVVEIRRLSGPAIVKDTGAERPRDVVVDDQTGEQP